MHPPFALNGPPQNPLQTPMQANFFPQQPGAPGRPSLHRSHPSVMQLAAAGILPPPGMPMTPLGQGVFPQPMVPGLAPFAPPFVPRSKRSASMSVGGPPKAVLGGPQRKVSPMPATPAAAVAAPATQPQKPKKVLVNLPRETIPGEGDEPPTRASFARVPLVESEIPVQDEVRYPETSTVELYPPDSWRNHLPPTVDVFLPGKAAWDGIKQRIIEEKLQKLGVERGSGSSVPHIHAPHARAASISSPADPALLFFKLNKLQQSQNASVSNSLSTSPQPPVNLSPSPSQLPPRLQNQNRHGHSISLAQPSSRHSPMYNPSGAFNPFGPNATLGSDQVLTRISPAPPSAAAAPSSEIIHAPQGRVPTSVASLAPPQVASRPESRPDFFRGFGVEIPEEEEPDEEEAPAPDAIADDVFEVAPADTTVASAEGTELDGMSTVAQSRIHSRHVSKLSAALSLRSVGGGLADESMELTEEAPLPVRSPAGELAVVDLDGDEDQEGDHDVDPDQEAVGEWTGSEDLRTTETSDDESIGEWSNPSDEERARQLRLHRRMMRRVKQVKQELEIPRRIPDFPRPPAMPVPVPGTAENVDDDIVSNPSDEGHGPYAEYFEQQAAAGRRPLPPLPHSRSGSQYSAQTGHDPALAHSRNASEQYLTPGGLHPRPSQLPQPQPALAPRTDLNPLAKPFVFGASRQSGSFAPSMFSSSSGTPGIATPPTHARAPSFGKPLNVAAPEFKPGGFTFRPPPGVPQLTFQPVQPIQPPQPPQPRPLPTPPAPAEPARASQGREKRQRRSSDSFESDGEGEDEDGVNTMHSFRFPPAASDSTPARHSAPASPPVNTVGVDKQSGLNVAAKPFTFTGSLPFLPQHKDDIPRSPGFSDDEENDENKPILPAPPVSMPVPQIGAEELPFPPTSKPKRAPIPLDFKHPVSTNTVPAGLFKALVNNEDGERTRRTVRSRLSSRDIYEHSPRQSLDDLHVPPISQRTGRNRLFTDPGFRDRDDSLERDDVFSVRRPRRSSLPPRRNDDEDDEESMSEISVAPMNLSKRIEMQQYEQRLEKLLEEKFETIKRTLNAYKSAASNGQAINSSTEAMISEVVTLFRAQLQESAARQLDEGLMDARGEFDFELLKGIIEQSHEESRAVLQREIATLLQQAQPNIPRDRDAELQRLIEDLGNRTINTLANAMSQLGARIQAMEASRAPSTNNEHLFQELFQKLLPHIAALRSDPIDYDVLTARLAQAVKPNISQLIDLASDKRETAGLIVDKLVPILPSLQPQIDLESVVGRLTSELKTIVGPLDPHEMKEQVSDLVVERLDSRLAVRDRPLNVDAISDKVTENVRGLVAPLADVQRKLEELANKEPVVTPHQVDLSAIQKDISDVLADLPQRLSAAVEALDSAQNEFKTKAARPENDASSKILRNIENVVSTFSAEQKKLVEQNTEFSDFCQDIIKHINSLPEAMVKATEVLQNAHADFAARDTSQKDSEEIRRLMSENSGLQVQLAKARGAHGQVRVEKDMLSDRVKAVEAERENLNLRVEALQDSISKKAGDTVALEAKNAELEEALARALERLKAADVQAQSQQEKLAELEKAKSGLASENQQLKARIESLEVKVTFITREKDTLADEIVSQKTLNAELVSQQSHWDELRQATEQIQLLTNLVGQVDIEEVKELRAIRDRSKVLEGEHAALQRRAKEFETKVANYEKVAQSSRQSLLQARQRAEEWERRAKEAETQLEVTQSKLDEVEQAHSQLDADYSLVKLQLEERDAEERLDKDRQNKLRDQIASLDGQVTRLQAELDKAKKANTTTAPTVLQPTARYQNGKTHPPPRPDSRASTVYNQSRAGTPKAQYNGTTNDVRVVTPPQASVRDSIHAPWRQSTLQPPVTPKSRYPSHYKNFRAPSPTPSVVSAAPTLGDDGWWS
ncbi:hypothetical protein DICSQDRAFT_149052 [Dichomitus squalens LYAD-421 SS1]|uniref:Uncharacterized protein n=1 Tax=Dichomitus squalens (strain LYAD-421) TaxID=732165 RepID=R7SQT8_DICSQ|nr:uncharacterized protein DICSQDRAFT_149052 [Dichomitus squalens LYAD-421 SS1]EJF58554.1 hypothetical protein DICSQDRAFT_149052 [Dichomitus squalens LYAD-421 SS1]